MLKQKYFLTDFFILSAEKQPIKLSWRNIEWLHKNDSFYGIMNDNIDYSIKNNYHQRFINTPLHVLEIYILLLFNKIVNGHKMQSYITHVKNKH